MVNGSWQRNESSEIHPHPLTHPPIHVAPSQTGRKSVRPCDVADFVFAAPEMYWLKDEFREERRCGRERGDLIFVD